MSVWRGTHLECDYLGELRTDAGNLCTGSPNPSLRSEDDIDDLEVRKEENLGKRQLCHFFTKPNSTPIYGDAVPLQLAVAKSEISKVVNHWPMVSQFGRIFVQGWILFSLSPIVDVEFDQFQEQNFAVRFIQFFQELLNPRAPTIDPDRLELIADSVDLQISIGFVRRCWQCHRSGPPGPCS